ncbi:MAG: enoyl-CoA hydratase/isomerase family protein [Chloroflexi bacterium]|nr:enoyl-CoA hydratase/isomerase family protein [Chloroflexota bacterium]MBM3173154.1 enoyl-CoA hydratase/isomerase family protein [Chloroflexota bacterium]MBM3174555.1 enoyl-CoA hydratase/isomerase family protein [Chloroflexota bacterium]MBM4450298.1 enoyl-CoA hydratase/isomerase family protein [Chloroflexota bacterium]
MKLETVIYEKKEDVAIIRFNRPKVLNAVNRQLTADFLAALRAAEADPGVKVLIVKGEGRAFCSGDDLSEDKTTATPEEGLRAINTLQDTTRTMLRMGKPIIGAIHGYALGAGCEWAMDCDIRIAAEGTKFGFPETSVGATITNAGTKILPLLVGMGRAKELALTGDRIDARQAEQWGLVNKVVPLEELDFAAMEMAKKIAKNSVLATHLTKTALNQGVYQDYEQVLEHETRDVMIAIMTFEAAQRAKAVLEKTKKKD